MQTGSDITVTFRVVGPLIEIDRECTRGSLSAQANVQNQHTGSPLLEWQPGKQKWNKIILYVLSFLLIFRYRNRNVTEDIFWTKNQNQSKLEFYICCALSYLVSCCDLVLLQAMIVSTIWRRSITTVMKFFFYMPKWSRMTKRKTSSLKVWSIAFWYSLTVASDENMFSWDTKKHTWIQDYDIIFRKLGVYRRGLHLFC